MSQRVSPFCSRKRLIHKDRSKAEKMVVSSKFPSPNLSFGKHYWALDCWEKASFLVMVTDCLVTMDC